MWCKEKKKEKTAQVAIKSEKVTQSGVLFCTIQKPCGYKLRFLGALCLVFLSFFLSLFFLLIRTPLTHPLKVSYIMAELLQGLLRVTSPN